MAREPVARLEIPEGITVSLDAGTFVMAGQKGGLNKDLRNPSIRFEIKDRQVEFFSTGKYSKREKKTVNTAIARLRNYFQGVSKGHLYRLKVCSGHFPMSVSAKGEMFEVKNFLGENTPRRLRLKKGPSVKINGDVIEIEGHDLDLVAQTAADIERLTRRPGFDKRRFMDGIWITEKNVREQ